MFDDDLTCLLVEGYSATLQKCPDMIRPFGYDYSKPDEKNIRCPACNAYGMNRLGMVITVIEVNGKFEKTGKPCPNMCYYGSIVDCLPDLIEQEK